MSERYDVTDLTIIIPSLNPDEKLIKTLDGLLDKGFKKIVVVDDGSDQMHQTPFHYAEIKGCTLLVHTENKGKGRALKTAFEHCLHTEDCIGVITVDGDGQHGSEDIYKCGSVMLALNKVVLGCRDFSEPQVPFKSKYGNNITKFAFKTLCGMRISDTQTGLRAIPVKFLADMLGIGGERFEYETNMLLEMNSRGIPWVEQKIETIYLDDNASSHFHPFKDSWKIYKNIFKYSLSTIFKYSVGSLLSSFVDLAAFTAVLYFLGSYIMPNTTARIYVATIFARVVSSYLNYSFNKQIVFKSTSKLSLLKYYVLCVTQMVVSAGFVSIIASLLPTNVIGKTTIKCFVDIILFFCSFVIQKKWVFRVDEGNSTGTTSHMRPNECREE